MAVQQDSILQDCECLGVLSVRGSQIGVAKAIVRFLYVLTRVRYKGTSEWFQKDPQRTWKA